MHSVAVRITGQIMKTPNYKRMGRRREGEKHLETETCGETSLQHPNSASTTLNSWQGSTTTTNRYYKKECIYTTSPNVPRGAKISNTSFPSFKASTTCVCVIIRKFTQPTKNASGARTQLFVIQTHMSIKA